MRASSGVALTCSGDMYDTVPTVLPGSVNSASAERVGSCEAPTAADPDIAFASPKSSIFGPRSVRKMFAGLMSRWTMPLLCAASSASATARAISTRAGGSIGPRASRCCERLSLEQLHRDERRIGCRRRNGADVGVVERGCGTCFALEAFKRLLGYRGPAWQDLDGHHTSETRVRRPIHLTHPSAAERRDDLVGAEARASSQRHDWIGALILVGGSCSRQREGNPIETSPFAPRCGTV